MEEKNENRKSSKLKGKRINEFLERKKINKNKTHNGILMQVYNRTQVVQIFFI